MAIPTRESMSTQGPREATGQERYPAIVGTAGKIIAALGFLTVVCGFISGTSYLGQGDYCNVLISAGVITAGGFALGVGAHLYARS